MVRLRRALIAVAAALLLVPAATAAADPVSLHSASGGHEAVTWKILPPTKLPGFPFTDGPDSVAVSGNGRNAFVLGPTQLVKLNVAKSPATITWRTANVSGRQIVTNPRHQIAYVSSSTGKSLKAVNTYPKTPVITKSFNYNCSIYCAITDIAITRNGKYLLVGVRATTHRVDIYSLTNPWKPKKVGHRNIGLRPDAIAPMPNGHDLVMQGVDMGTGNHQYMVLNIRHPKQVKIVKHRTLLPFTYGGPVVPAPGGSHVYLVGEDTSQNVYIIDMKPSGHWPITRNRKVMKQNDSLVSGADITTTGKYIYIARNGIPSDNTTCIFGFAHLTRADCYTGMDDPDAGVVLSKAGPTRDRAYIPEGQVNTRQAWLNVLSPPKP